ncbi:MAG TPA: hypothetical protein VJO14_05835 [Bacteroidota bacterium]|nr:hypothetical protein [Bacteroidota bacterium]
MIDRVRSLYLRDEKKYDKWGAQGKILAAQDVFRREGIVMGREKIEKFVNIAFPRTFSCQKVPGERDPVPSPAVLESHRASISRLFREHGLPPASIEQLALEETAERFCLDSRFLRSYLKK